MLRLICISALFSFILFNKTEAQNSRLADVNSIGWFAGFGAFKISPKLSIHAELQVRRDEFLNNPQQTLLRTGLIYSPLPSLSAQIGYAHVLSSVYGDYPAVFPSDEHRMYEQFLIKNPIGKVDLSHRFTFEQRFVERKTVSNGSVSSKYAYLNRVRYRFRGEIPLSAPKAKKPVTAIIQDEVFIGYGKNLGVNVFDQNRLHALIGCRLNQNLKLEGGYNFQLVQQANTINNKSVYQYNHGFLLAAFISADLMKKR